MNFSIMGMWKEMGPVPKGVVVVLLIMSVYSLSVAVERLLALRRGRRQSMAYIRALQPLLATPGRLNEAAAIEQQWPGSPVARVIASGLTEFARGMVVVKRRLRQAAPDGAAAPTDGVIEGASRSMERIKERELINLRRGLPGLATIASSAPFVGLLGTVFGIITAFAKMADPSNPGGLATVSGGIAEALLTTAVGLTVAIVSVWFYNFLTTRVDHITVDVDETTSEVIDCMIREQDELPLPGGGGPGGPSWPARR
jgi:biopolymer transport protein ExbB